MPRANQDVDVSIHRRALLKAAALGLVASGRAVGREEAPAAEPPPRLVRQWGRKGSEPGEFDAPIAIAVAPEGDVFVTDFRNARVQRFTSEGVFASALDVGGFPSGIALGKAGEVFVSHFGFEGLPDRITVHDRAGKLLREWGKSGKGDGEFDMPGGVALSADGRVYIADQTNRRVQVFDPSGEFLFKWGEYGVGPGQFGGNTGPRNRTGGPHFVAFDGKGDVYVTEASVGRIQVFTPEGKFLRAWGDNADKPGSFGGRPKNLPGPLGLCIDKNNRVWVSATSNRVQQFTKEGAFLRGFGKKGAGPSEFETPHGLALDRDGLLYVVDTLNSRVQVFDVGQEPSGRRLPTRIP